MVPSRQRLYQTASKRERHGQVSYAMLTTLFTRATSRRVMPKVQTIAAPVGRSHWMRGRHRSDSLQHRFPNPPLPLGLLCGGEGACEPCFASLTTAASVVFSLSSCSIRCTIIFIFCCISWSSYFNDSMLS